MRSLVSIPHRYYKSTTFIISGSYKLRVSIPHRYYKSETVNLTLRGGTKFQFLIGIINLGESEVNGNIHEFQFLIGIINR